MVPFTCACRASVSGSTAGPATTLSYPAGPANFESETAHHGLYLAAPPISTESSRSSQDPPLSAQSVIETARHGMNRQWPHGRRAPALRGHNLTFPLMKLTYYQGCEEPGTAAERIALLQRYLRQVGPKIVVTDGVGSLSFEAIDESEVIESTADELAFDHDVSHPLVDARLVKPPEVAAQPRRLPQIGHPHDCDSRSHPTISFLNREDSTGLRLSDALRFDEHDRSLGESDPSILDSLNEITLRLRLPPDQVINTTCSADEGRSRLSKAKIAYRIATLIRDYIGEQVWKEDTGRALTLEDLCITELRQATGGIWQPVLVVRHPPTSTPQKQATTPPDRLKVPPHGTVLGTPLTNQDQTARRPCESESSPRLEHSF